MLVIQRNRYGYFVECLQCGVVLEITGEDVEDGQIECGNCRHVDRFGDEEVEDYEREEEEE